MPRLPIHPSRRDFWPEGPGLSLLPGCPCFALGGLTSCLTAPATACLSILESPAPHTVPVLAYRRQSGLSYQIEIYWTKALVCTTESIPKPTSTRQHLPQTGCSLSSPSSRSHGFVCLQALAQEYRRNKNTEQAALYRRERGEGRAEPCWWISTGPDGVSI